MELLERIAKADPTEVPEDGELLLKTFCAGVTDPNLRWELKQQLKAQPQSSFIELRDTALHLLMNFGFRISWGYWRFKRGACNQVLAAEQLDITNRTLDVALASTAATLCWCHC